MQAIWTIGHSNHSLDFFIKLLNENSIKVLADVRRFPGSSRYPYFNKENLKHSLKEEGIEYLHFEDLGGRRKTSKDSKNTAWRNDAFRGYADYMETIGFKNSFSELIEVSKGKSTAIMCSEVLWWQCHRSLLSDLLKSIGYTVNHILPGKIQEHPYSSAAKIVDGKLNYAGEQMGLF